jgi:signal-transduction protein with cAMP-binding, CBS, and nucleotidyltransferase domain
MPVEEGGRIVGMVTEKELLEHSEVLHSYSERLARYQNIQSYIIIAFFIILLVIFIMKL